MNIFSYFRRSDKSQIELNVIVDNPDNPERKQFTVKTISTANLSTVRQQIPDLKNFKENCLVWFFNNQFWKDETPLNRLLSESDSDSLFEIHLIGIPSTQLHNIKYANLTKSKQNSFDKLKELPLREIISDFFCPNCKQSYPLNQTIEIALCNHRLCKNCVSEHILNFSINGFKCPQSDCQRLLCDHEIQLALDTPQYDIFQDRVLQEIQKNKGFVYPRIGWTCEICTCVNLHYVKFCVACNSNRPSNFKNPKYWQPSDNERKLMTDYEEKERKDLENEKFRLAKETEERQKNLEDLKRLIRKSVIKSTEVTTCPICGDESEPGNAIILHSCHHTICFDCFKEYLKNVDDAQVKCPTENCIGFVEDQEIRTILSEDEYTRYEELSLRMAEAKDKQAFHCKEVNCTAWISYEGIVRNFKCPQCKKENCIPCEAIHEGKTCIEYRRSLANTISSSEADDLFIKQMIESGEAMKCPGCGILVQKTKGCDGVTCKSCGIMMCWATKGPRWGPKGKGDTSGGCGCRYFFGKKCHPNCHYCH